MDTGIRCYGNLHHFLLLLKISHALTKYVNDEDKIIRKKYILNIAKASDSRHPPFDYCESRSSGLLRPVFE